MNDVVEIFLVVKESEGRAKSTIYEHRHYLTSFAAHCGKTLNHVTSIDLASWLNDERKSRGLSEKSVYARWASVRSFFTWCVAEKMLPDTPITIKPPKRRKRTPRVAAYAHVQRIMDIDPTSWTDNRDKAIIHLLLDTGMRIGEVMGLHIADVDLIAKRAKVTVSKDSEDRLVPFTKSCANAIQEYLDCRPDCKHTHLFLGTRGSVILGRLTVSGAQQMIERRCRALGIAYVNPHSVRHLFATRALNAGMRVEVVSRILGHSSVDFTLKVYASLLLETVQREYDQHWK